MINLNYDLLSAPRATLSVVSSLEETTQLSTSTAVVELVVSISRLCTVMVLVPVAVFLFNYILLLVPFKGARFRVCIAFFVTLIDMLELHLRLKLIAYGGFDRWKILVSFWWSAKIIICFINCADLLWKYWKNKCLNLATSYTTSRLTNCVFFKFSFPFFNRRNNRPTLSTMSETPPKFSQELVHLTPSWTTPTPSFRKPPQR